MDLQKYTEAEFDLKRDQLKRYLLAETRVKDFPPPIGRWMVQGDIIYIGVDDAGVTLRANEYTDDILEIPACHGKLIGLKKDATLAKLTRGKGNYELPEMPRQADASPGRRTAVPACRRTATPAARQCRA